MVETLDRKDENSQDEFSIIGERMTPMDYLLRDMFSANPWMKLLKYHWQRQVMSAKDLGERKACNCALQVDFHNLYLLV